MREKFRVGLDALEAVGDCPRQFLDADGGLLRLLVPGVGLGEDARKFANALLDCRERVEDGGVVVREAVHDGVAKLDDLAGVGGLGVSLD